MEASTQTSNRVENVWKDSAHNEAVIKGSTRGGAAAQTSTRVEDVTVGITPRKRNNLVDSADVEAVMGWN